MEINEKNKKTARCSKHFQIYLDYVSLYKVLKMKWTAQREYSAQIENIWQDMTKKLNESGGPVRDVTHWKKVFTEWKSHTRRKIKNNKPLNDVEKQLVQITGLSENPERKLKIKQENDNKTINKSEEFSQKIKEELDDIEAEEICETENIDNSSPVDNGEEVNKAKLDANEISFDKATQVNRFFPENWNAVDLTGVAAALQNVANAINRYCDLIDRRFT